ncbi:MAG: VOC family protein [Candidatus Hermodarchaeota archaeon]
MENDIKVDLGALKVDQLGFVYKDIKKQAELMKSIFKLPNFIFSGPKSHSYVYRGKESEVTLDVGISRIGNTQIELIQLIEGECVYNEFLDQGKQGLQHIGVYVENVQQSIADFEKLGIKPIQTGRVLRHIFAYMDTEAIFGTIIELLELMKRKKKR